MIFVQRLSDQLVEAQRQDFSGLTFEEQRDVPRSKSLGSDAACQNLSPKGTGCCQRAKKIQFAKHFATIAGVCLVYTPPYASMNVSDLGLSPV
eukprot:1068420-Amphidinium_carterae.3